jgi:hypothetical protein
MPVMRPGTAMIIPILLAFMGAAPAQPKSTSPLPPNRPDHIFVFRADEFWLNLHHFLYVLGRAQNHTRDSSRAAVAGAPADEEKGMARLKESDQTIWREAVSAYADGLSKKDLIFDDRTCFQQFGSLTLMGEDLATRRLMKSSGEPALNRVTSQSRLSRPYAPVANPFSEWLTPAPECSSLRKCLSESLAKQ